MSRASVRPVGQGVVYLHFSLLFEKRSRQQQVNDEVVADRFTVLTNGLHAASYKVVFFGDIEQVRLDSLKKALRERAGMQEDTRNVTDLTFVKRLREDPKAVADSGWFAVKLVASCDLGYQKTGEELARLMWEEDAAQLIGKRVFVVFNKIRAPQSPELGAMFKLLEGAAADYGINLVRFPAPSYEGDGSAYQQLVHKFAKDTFGKHDSCTKIFALLGLTPEPKAPSVAAGPRFMSGLRQARVAARPAAATTVPGLTFRR